MAQWSPTHVQVTVVRAKNLVLKSKSAEFNSAYVTIQLGKEKFATSVAEKTKPPEWNEECDLRVNDLSGTIVLTAYHKHQIGTDDFLGRVEIPLQDVNFFDRPKNIWFPLRSKKKESGKEEKYRGEIQIRLNFYVQNLAASTPNLAENGIKKERSNSFKNKISNQLGKTLPNRKHGGSVMDIRTPNSGAGFFGSLKRSLSKKELNNPFVNSIENSPVIRPPVSPFVQQPTPDWSMPDKRNGHLTAEKLSDDVSLASSSYDDRQVRDVDPPQPQLIPVVAPVVKSSSFSKTKQIVNSLIHSGTNGTNSANSLSRTASEIDIGKMDSARNSKISTMTVETKRNSAYSESEKSPRLNGEMFINHRSRFTDAEPSTPLTIHVPKELMRKFGHLDKSELIAKLGDAEEKLGEKQTEIERMQSYIESLLLRVMDTAPKILQANPSPLKR